MRLARFRGHRRDEGSTQIVMLLAMVCALGLSVLAIQVAQANDMRSRAQIAADAAAIAAVTPLRDAALSRALNGTCPGAPGCGPSSRTRTLRIRFITARPRTMPSAMVRNWQGKCVPAVFSARR